MKNNNNRLNFIFSSDLEEGWELITANGDYIPVVQLLEEAYYDRLQWLFDMCHWGKVSTDWVLLDCQSIVDKVGNISNQFTAGIITRQEKDGKIIEKGTMCKMARGEMVRYMAEHQIEDPEKIKDFHRLDYHFDATKSSEETFVFVRKGAAACNLD